MIEADFVLGGHYVLTGEASVSDHDDSCGVTFPKGTVFVFNGAKEGYNHFWLSRPCGIGIYFWVGENYFYDKLEPFK